MTTAPDKGWKYYLGLVLFVYSLATFGLAALTPFLFAPAVAATAATGIVISGEVGFWISAALLGKQFVQALKNKIRGFFARPASAPGAHQPPPSCARLGAVLAELRDVLPGHVRPVLRVGQGSGVDGHRVVAISGELLFLTSLLVLGGDFWDRLMALYRWPGQPPANSPRPSS